MLSVLLLWKARKEPEIVMLTLQFQASNILPASSKIAQQITQGMPQHRCNKKDEVDRATCYAEITLVSL